MRIAVTGAFGFSGKYIARRVLDIGHEVMTLTNSPHRANPFGESVQAFPYHFSQPQELEKSLWYRCADQHLLGQVRQAAVFQLCPSSRQCEGLVREREARWRETPHSP